MPKLPQNWLTFLVGILLINVIGLWTVYVIREKPEVVTTAKRPFSPSNQISPSSPELSGIDLVAQNDQEIQELKDQLARLQTEVASLSAEDEEANVTRTVFKNSTRQEDYIYLGSGSTSNRTWTEMTGTRTTIDTRNYGSIKEVTFQAALSIIGGEVHARLVNKTTGAIFTMTEVNHNNQNSTWKSSVPFTLTSGSNDYVVELRSSSGELAQLSGARLKLIVQ